MNTEDPLDNPACLFSDSPNHAMDFFDELPNSVMFNGAGFFHYLNHANNTNLWVMSYTFKANNGLNLPISRLVYSVGESHNKQSKKLNGIHTKLYLQFLNKKLIAAYIGSQNLVRPTNANLMIKVPTKHLPVCKKYFLHFWNQA